LQMGETHILIKFLWMYIPRNWEFGSALSKPLTFWVGFEPPKHRQGGTEREATNIKSESNTNSHLATCLFLARNGTDFNINLTAAYRPTKRAIEAISTLLATCLWRGTAMLLHCSHITLQDHPLVCGIVTTVYNFCR
jgi:hypothetical protein